jgi:nucleoside-diphosphate-sugar epimerase
MLGDVTPTRDFNYVEDTCSGFIEIAKCDATVGGVYNIGSGSEISIMDTLELIKRLMSSDIRFIVENERIRPKNSEVFRLCCDNKKLIKATGFKTSYSIESGLKKTIDWFRNSKNLDKYKANIYNV